MLCFAPVVRIKQQFSLNTSASLFTLSHKFASAGEEEAGKSLVGKSN